MGFWDYYRDLEGLAWGSIPPFPTKNQECLRVRNRAQACGMHGVHFGRQKGLGFRGLGFSGLGVLGLGFRVYRVWGFKLRVKNGLASRSVGAQLGNLVAWEVSGCRDFEVCFVELSL